VKILSHPLRKYNLNLEISAIQTLQRVGRGKEGGEWVWQLVWGKYLEET